MGAGEARTSLAIPRRPAARLSASQDRGVRRRRVPPADHVRSAEGGRHPSARGQNHRGLRRLASDRPRGVSHPGIRAADQRRAGLPRRSAGACAAAGTRRPLCRLCPAVARRLLHRRYRARSIIEPPAARLVAERKSKDARPCCVRKSPSKGGPEHRRFRPRRGRFPHDAYRPHRQRHAHLLSSVLDGIVARHHALVAGRSAGKADPTAESRGFNTGMRSQEKLVALIETGEGAEAEAHWRRHMDAAAKIWLGGGAGEMVVSWSR